MHDRKKYMKAYLKVYQPKYYKKNRTHTIKQVAKTQNIRKRNNRLRALELLGNKCSKCGYNRCSAALDFHHPNPSTKSDSLGHLWGKKWETILKEVKKCVILCANCHREEHNKGCVA